MGFTRFGVKFGMYTIANLVNGLQNPSKYKVFVYTIDFEPCHGF